jgi:ubiquinone/menaquinone biosynthesis C-methylase UbiE
MNANNNIIKYYDLGKEARRLFDGVGQLEFLRSKELISKHIGKSSGKILDIGGGTGPYSFWLANKGHAVYLIDPVSLHIEQAKEKSSKAQNPLQHIAIGDARELKFANNFFDIVIMFGPLYHLTKEKDRIKALQEAKRVLLPGGLVFVVGISQFASTMNGFFENFVQDSDFVAIMQQDLINGHHRNPTVKDCFTNAYFHHPEKLKQEVKESGLLLKNLYAVESFGWLIPDFDAKWSDPKFRKLLLETIKTVEQDNSIMGISSHIMVIAQKE